MAGPDPSVFAGASPWQLWGNTQIVEAPANLFTNPNLHEQQITLLRMQYNRPETWRFMFAARIVDAPDMDAISQASVAVWFELFTGIGRSAIKIPFFVTMPGWQWSFGSSAPRNLIDWTNSAVSGSETWFTDETPQVITTVPIRTDLIIGQDITIVAHVNFTTDLVGTDLKARVEVSGQFAPNVHVRPDWFLLDGHPSEQFAGGEVRGR